MEPVIGSYKISLTCLVRQAKAEDGAIPDGVAANIAAALLLTAGTARNVPSLNAAKMLRNSIGRMRKNCGSAICRGFHTCSNPNHKIPNLENRVANREQQ
jgi:hypothetical protein